MQNPTYYKDADGNIYEYSSSQTPKKALVKLTEGEVNAHRNPKPTTDQLLQQLAVERKEQETQGVTINDIRYAGDPGNRQALQEAIAFMNDAGLTEFTKWKDSDNVFHVDLPVSEVFNAYRAVGMRRVQLISAEGDYAKQIIAGTLTDLTQVTWP